VTLVATGRQRFAINDNRWQASRPRAHESAERLCL